LGNANQTSQIGTYNVQWEDVDVLQANRQSLLIGVATVTHSRTRQSQRITVSALRRSGIEVIGSTKRFDGTDSHRLSELRTAFLAGANRTEMSSKVSEAGDPFDLGAALPNKAGDIVAGVAEHTMDARRLEIEIRAQHGSIDPDAYLDAIEIARQADTSGAPVTDRASASAFQQVLERAVHSALDASDRTSIQVAQRLVQTASELGLPIALDKTQEMVLAAVRERSDDTELVQLAEAVNISPEVWSQAQQHRLLANGAMFIEASDDALGL
jgi:hypothetical protein